MPAYTVSEGKVFDGVHKLVIAKNIGTVAFHFPEAVQITQLEYDDVVVIKSAEGSEDK